MTWFHWSGSGPRPLRVSENGHVRGKLVLLVG